MRVVGGVTGLLLGGLAALLTAVGLGLTVAAGPVVAMVGFLGVTPAALIVVALAGVFFVTTMAYIAGAVATIPLMAGPPSGAALPFDPMEAFSGGLITGVTTGLNTGLWICVGGPVGVALGAVLGLIGFLSLLPLSRSPAFQAVLGWSSWLMPWSWLATALGLVLFVINAPVAVVTLGLRAIRLDVTTGSVETTGGLVGITGFTGGGFNLGNFSFLSPAPGVGLGIQTSFTAPGLSAHEAGHVLSVASFGGVFHWLDAIDENVPPLARGRRAYGELISESHIPRPLPIRHVRIWS